MAGLLSAGLTTTRQCCTSLGDIIVGIDGQPVKRMDDIIVYLEEHKSIGETVKLTIIRNGQTIYLTATDFWGIRNEEKVSGIEFDQIHVP
jgi:S1-C subfamily serine protease